MKHDDLKLLQSAAQPLPPTATKRFVLESVANAVKAIGQTSFKSLINVEGDIKTLRATAVAGTILEPVAEALKAGGRDPGGTVGGVMDAMPLNQTEVNALACHCANGATMTGAQAANNLENLAKKC